MDWSSVSHVRQIQLVDRSNQRPTDTLITVLVVLPLAALARDSPFDTGLTSIQSLFTGSIFASD
jgi:hypothetical protein